MPSKGYIRVELTNEDRGGAYQVALNLSMTTSSTVVSPAVYNSHEEVQIQPAVGDVCRFCYNLRTHRPMVVMRRRQWSTHSPGDAPGTALRHLPGRHGRSDYFRARTSRRSAGIISIVSGSRKIMGRDGPVRKSAQHREQSPFSIDETALPGRAFPLYFLCFVHLSALPPAPAFESSDTFRFCTGRQRLQVGFPLILYASHR
jgi:hypothetical protein